MSTSKPKVKASGIIKDSPLYHAINMLMSRFDELEKRMFGAPFVTLPYDAYTSVSAPFASKLNMGGHFTTIMIRTCLYLLINLNWPLWCLKPIGPI